MKKILALALIASLCLSACSGTGGESSTSNSNTSTSTSEGTTSSSSAVEQSSSSINTNASTSSTTEGTLTLEEIKTIFSELDAKRNDMVKWVLKDDYGKIPIDNVPVHKIENVETGIIGTENGFLPVYGTAVFAKVTEETLPGFPWSSVDEIKNDILKIYKSISESIVLEYMVSEDINDPNGIFYQFDDGLYFRVSDDHYRPVGYNYWDYSTIEILQNEPDKIDITMRWAGSDSRSERSLVKNESGNWVIGSIF